MMKLCVRYLSLSFLLFGGFLLAQSGNPDFLELEEIEYGSVAPKWLEMTQYELDTTAAAVILADVGYAKLEWLGSKQVVSYTYHRRIKILKEEGLETAKFDLTIDPRKHSLTQIEASTYNINPEGDVVQFKVDRRALRDQSVDRRRRKVGFRFPLAKVGSVIEYVYTYYTTRLDVLQPWIFQREYPVSHSEFHLILPETHQYQRVMQGDLRNMVMLEEPWTFQRRINQDVNNGNGFMGQASLGTTNYVARQPGTHQTFIMRRVAALRDDKFGPKTEALLPGLRFQLSGEASGDQVNGVYRNWQQLNRTEQKKLKKGRLRINHRYLAQTARRVGRRETGNINKAEAIFRWVREEFTWDSSYTRQPSRLDRVIRDRRGSSADLNMLTILLIRELGLDAAPILISTRSHGPVQVVAANAGQFNHMIGGFRINGTDILFDVLGEFDELGILPAEDLNQAGYWLDVSGGRWIRLQSNSQIVRFTYSRFSLNREGLLTGDISVTNKSYSAALERSRLVEVDAAPQEYLRQYVLTGMESPSISDMKIENLDVSGEPLVVGCNLQTNDFVRQIDDLMFISPTMTKQIGENPFEGGERASPVDLTYPLRESHLLGLRIPEGYEIAQLPQPIRVVMPNDAGLFVFNVLEMDDIVHVSSCIFLNQTVFLPAEYEGIRTFFDFIVRKHGEDIVLKRKMAATKVKD